MTTTPLLNLKTEAPQRRAVNIDGEDYYLILMQSLSLGARLGLSRSIDRVVAIEQKTEEFTAEDEKEYTDLVMKVCSTVLPDCPTEVLEQLNQLDRESIFGAFLGLSVQGSSRIAMMAQLRSELSPPDSNSTTEAVPAAG